MFVGEEKTAKRKKSQRESPASLAVPSFLVLLKRSLLKLVYVIYKKKCVFKLTSFVLRIYVSVPPTNSLDFLFIFL